MNIRHGVRWWGIMAGVSGFLAVALGAFGAHGLESILTPKYLKTYNTAVEYQFYHSLALLLTTVLLQQNNQRRLHWAAGFFLVGMLLFSGSLYLLVLTGHTWIGMITPLGGLCFLAGWGSLFFTFIRR